MPVKTQDLPFRILSFFIISRKKKIQDLSILSFIYEGIIEKCLFLSFSLNKVMIKQ